MMQIIKKEKKNVYMQGEFNVSDKGRRRTENACKLKNVGRTTPPLIDLGIWSLRTSLMFHLKFLYFVSPYTI